jgi:FkbM family methyltransferase
MRLKQKAMNSATRLLKAGIQVLGESKASVILAKLAEDLAPVLDQQTQFGTIRFYCIGKLPESRARTLLTKEPDTIAWINTFRDRDTFWDIGANVGTYSLYAALRNVTVLSFEPSPGNYYLLSRNIEINRMDDRMSALCIAFNNDTRLDWFYMTNTELGGAKNSFGEAVDWQGKPFTPFLKHAMIGFSVDDFVQHFNPPFPNHIKIDVDGIENKIVKGAQNTLADRRVKSILVELDSARNEYCNEVIEVIERAGIKCSERKHAPVSDDNKFTDTYNYIFIRPDS